jgi:hypothetical protein
LLKNPVNDRRNQEGTVSVWLDGLYGFIDLVALWWFSIMARMEVFSTSRQIALFFEEY